MPSNHQTTMTGHKDIVLAMEVMNSLAFPMTMRAIVDLGVLDIIAKAGEGAQLSPSEIAAQLATKNPEAADMLDRMMRLLACHSILNCSISIREDGKVERLYGLEPVCKYYVKDKNGSSFAPCLALMQHPDLVQSWYHLKDAVLEGGVPFERAYGMQVFDYFNKKPDLIELFHKFQFVYEASTDIFEVYTGFNSLKEVVDVGGGLGATISAITAKYPNIKGINFDLPQVIEHAPSYPGVKHIGGDMFVSVPKGENIFMKFVLHNWDDQRCLALLKNCYEALSDHGKVIVVDSILPLIPKDDAVSRVPCQEDIYMMSQTTGGKERTEKEFEALAVGAGFACFKMVCSTNIYWIMEFCKKCKI
uniref:Flavonol 3-O-methyltransferase n=1 Tax=Dysosma versipellis TaxID=93611 RepID=A0A0E3GID7_9MAGN|nr:flavonol 3-O-methyltransferase [Dysosma versipellis]